MADAAWLRLAYAAQHGSAPWAKALDVAGSAAALVAASERELAALGLNGAQIERFRSVDSTLLGRWERWLAGADRALIVRGGAGYPPLLAQTPDAPLALWTHGTCLAALGAPQLAVVGSRNPTSNGAATALDFARYLAERGLTITSGLAVGIDGAGHRGALAAGGTTVAVLGSGIDVIFPRAHQPLAMQVAAAGVVVSEYAPGTPPQKQHFPHRNRIIAGLSAGTLVVEAARHSGSLITAKLATDYGREVFAIPGSIHSPLSRGCHHLIREGAKLVEEAGDILVELAAILSIPVNATVVTERGPYRQDDQSPVEDPAYARLLERIDYGPTAIATLMERVGLTAAEVSSMLLVLELEGFVEALPGGRYARLAKRSS